MPNTSAYRYSNCSTLIVGCYLYSDNTLTTPLSNGFYSDSGSCITVAGGAGQISSIVVCGGSITYIDYLANKYDCPSGNLVATSVNVALADTISPNLTKFYVPSLGSGEQGLFVYELLSTGGTAGLILDDLWADSAALACSIF
jgi:hypothetical protein